MGTKRSERLTGRGTTVLLVLVLLAGALAGCLGNEEPAAEDDPTNETGEDQQEDQAEVLPWGLSACRVVVAIVPVDEQALAEHLPEGFETVSGEEAFGLPPDFRGEAALGFETFHCEQGAGLQGPVEDLDYGALFAPVDPPENATHPDADAVFYKWETLVPDQDRREALAEAGLPVVDGSTDLSDIQQVGEGFVFDVSLTLGGADFGFSGGADQPAQEFREGIPFVEPQQADDGLALWGSLDNEATDANQGTGTLEIDPSHWSSDVVGAETTQAFMVASTDVTFREAFVRLP